MNLENLQFRAWDKRTKLMNDVTTIDLEQEIVFYHHWKYGHSKAIPFSDVILLQYTGLKDKNDTEIFEGDILKYWGECRPVVSHEASFGWIEGGYYIPFPMMCISEISNTEVIGNIYENEDLLK